MMKVDEQFMEKMVEEGKFKRYGDYLLREDGFNEDEDMDGYAPRKMMEGFKIGDEIEDENDTNEYMVEDDTLLKDN